MMPPLVRRCPDCGFVGAVRRFETVEGSRLVACPACGYHFERVDDPMLT